MVFEKVWIGSPTTKSIYKRWFSSSPLARMVIAQYVQLILEHDTKGYFVSVLLPEVILF